MAEFRTPRVHFILSLPPTSFCETITVNTRLIMLVK
jgi:hypothetical protein